MSASPGAMQALLAQQLMQGPTAGTMGGGIGGPQMQGSITPMNGAANMAQKIMLMRALQQQAPQQQPSPQQQIPQPQPNTMGGVNGIPQQMNQQPLPGGSNA
jgi:hypothetical protein